MVVRAESFLDLEVISSLLPQNPGTTGLGISTVAQGQFVQRCTF